MTTKDDLLVKIDDLRSEVKTLRKDKDALTEEVADAEKTRLSLEAVIASMDQALDQLLEVFGQFRDDHYAYRVAESALRTSEVTAIRLLAEVREARRQARGRRAY